MPCLYLYEHKRKEGALSITIQPLWNYKFSDDGYVFLGGTSIKLEFGQQYELRLEYCFHFCF